MTEATKKPLVGREERMWASDMNRELLRLYTHNFPGTLSLNAARVLAEIVYENVRDRHPGVRELAEATGIPVSTVSRIVIGFIADGLLEDRRDQCTSARQSYIVLTKKGLSVTFKHAEAMMEFKAKIIDQKNV